MAIFCLTKDPSEVISYTFTWTTELGSDTISSAAWTVPSGLTNVTSSASTTATTVRLSGGTLGARYEVVCHVIGTSGQEYERTLHLQIENK